jgi:alkanesulfonate monooxygenase SsuD/methylene tetrahydromethanopterin reductase-like flavin-dependent oxidoreductase (luciferase family)
MDIGLHFDMRNPAYPGRSFEELASGILEYAVLAEKLGFTSLWTSEHHFTSDGDTPSPLVLCGALAAITRKLRIGTNLVVLPLHNPLRLAEDAATLAILSGGRFDLGVGAGYLPSNYAAFGQTLRRRGALMEEGLSILRRAWAGESVGGEGTCWTLPDVVVQPLPAPGNEPRLFVGGFTPPAINRAARLGDGFLCGLPASIDTYLEALDEIGKPREDGKIAIMQWWIVAEDPERTWSEIGEHALYQVNKYVATGGFGEDMKPFENADELIERGHYTLYDGASAVRELSSLIERVPQIVNMQLYGLLPGEPVSSGVERMEYVAKTVLPHFA